MRDLARHLGGGDEEPAGDRPGVEQAHIAGRAAPVELREKAGFLEQQKVVDEVEHLVAVGIRPVEVEHRAIDVGKVLEIEYKFGAAVELAGGKHRDGAIAHHAHQHFFGGFVEPGADMGARDARPHGGTSRVEEGGHDVEQGRVEDADMVGAHDLERDQAGAGKVAGDLDEDALDAGAQRRRDKFRNVHEDHLVKKGHQAALLYLRKPGRAGAH